MLLWSVFPEIMLGIKISLLILYIFWTLSSNLSGKMKNIKHKNTKQRFGAAANNHWENPRNMERFCKSSTHMLLTQAQSCLWLRWLLSHPCLPVQQVTLRGKFQMAAYLHGPHFLLNKDKFHSFHILKSNTDCGAYFGGELTAAGYRQRPRLCMPFTRSRGRP